MRLLFCQLFPGRSAQMTNAHAIPCHAWRCDRQWCLLDRLHPGIMCSSSVSEAGECSRGGDELFSWSLFNVAGCLITGWIIRKREEVVRLHIYLPVWEGNRKEPEGFADAIMIPFHRRHHHSRRSRNQPFDRERQTSSLIKNQSKNLAQNRRIAE